MADQTKHISSGFDAALYGLRNDVLMMASLTDRMFQMAFEALLKRDSELCGHAIAEDEEIDILEKQVDQEGVSLLLRFHPVVSDMRSYFCEEDQHESGAYYGPIRHYRAKSKRPKQQVSSAGGCLAGASLSVGGSDFRDSVRAFADGDRELERTAKLKDRELDAVTRDISEKLVARGIVDSELVLRYVDLILVARALERIGDHATNIAEDSFWRDQAADIRHTYDPKK